MRKLPMEFSGSQYLVENWTDVTGWAEGFPVETPRMRSIPCIVHRTVPPSTTEQFESVWQTLVYLHRHRYRLTHREPPDPDE